MNWAESALLICVLILTLGTLVKIHLQRRLRDIDGFAGVHKENANEPHGKILGSFGDDSGAWDDWDED